MDCKDERKWKDRLVDSVVLRKDEIYLDPEASRKTALDEEGYNKCREKTRWRNHRQREILGSEEKEQGALKLLVFESA